MKYKLVLGDCLEVMKDIPDGSIDLVLTDPPYGINYKSNLQTGDRRSGTQIQVRPDNYFEEIQNDKSFPTKWLSVCYDKLKDTCALYIFLHWSKWSELEQSVQAAGFKVKNMIVINKSNHGMGDLRGNYAPKHELVLFATKGRHILNNLGGRKKNVMDLPVKYSGSYHHHPNEKPLSWVEPFIQESSSENNVILDPFMGSGTTGVACKNLNRNFIGIELDLKYFEIAKKRIEEGNK